MFDPQRLAFLDRDQSVRSFEFLKFGVVLNAGQFQAVDLFILPEQGIVRRTEHRVPAHMAPVRRTTQFPRPCVVPGGNIQRQGIGVRADGEHQRENRGEHYPKLPGPLGHGAQLLGRAETPLGREDALL